MDGWCNFLALWHMTTMTKTSCSCPAAMASVLGDVLPPSHGDFLKCVRTTNRLDEELVSGPNHLKKLQLSQRRPLRRSTKVCSRRITKGSQSAASGSTAAAPSTRSARRWGLKRSSFVADGPIRVKVFKVTSAKETKRSTNGGVYFCPLPAFGIERSGGDT